MFFVPDPVSGEVNYEKVKRMTVSFFAHAFLVLVSLACIFPLWWAFASSLKTQETVFNDLSLFPANPHWENYFYDNGRVGGEISRGVADAV